MADRSNSITTANIGTYLATLINGQSNNLYLALGIGDSTWDSSALPIPQPNMTQLENETFRKSVDMTKCVYVDPSDYTIVVGVPTSVIRIEVEISELEYSGVFREYGLFGIDATETLDSGVLIQYSNFDAKSIPGGSSSKIWIYLSI